MKTIQLNLYAFTELNEDARENAINEHRFINVETNWWQFIYEDAEMSGLKIKGFDLDRAFYCNADFIEDAIKTAGLILENHGEPTNTYQLGLTFTKGREELVQTWPKEANGEFTDVDDMDLYIDRIEDKFLEIISSEYLKMLLKEYDYLISDTQVSETLTANEYLFTADGKIANALEKLAQA